MKRLTLFTKKKIKRNFTIDEYNKAYSKITNCINSCTNINQLNACLNLINNFEKLFGNNIQTQVFVKILKEWYNHDKIRIIQAL